MDHATLAAAVWADQRTRAVLRDYLSTVADRERLIAYVRQVVAQAARDLARRQGKPPPDRETMTAAADMLAARNPP